MKANAFPAAAVSLGIPSWVPVVIAQYVSARHAADADRAYRAALAEIGWFEHDELDDMPREHLFELVRDDVVLRERIADLVRDELADITWRYLPLACDHRMEGVWWELSRQHANGGFLHPAIGLDQDAAMLELFKAALACWDQRGATTTQRAVELQRDHYLARADELRDDAITMLAESPRDKSHERFRKLQAAAQAYEDQANAVYAASLPMSLKRSHDGRARWVALTLGNAFRTLFGSPMYGLTAKITSVVLGREIEPGAARQWLKTWFEMRKFAATRHSAVKPPKFTP